MDRKERKKRYNDRHRAKNVEKLREQDRERKRLMRLKQTNNPEAHDEQKRKDKDRKYLRMPLSLLQALPLPPTRHQGLPTNTTQPGHDQ